jgi:NCAIR mutase (PurE)-related protein
MKKPRSESEILALLKQVRTGDVLPEDALTRLKIAPFEDLGYAKTDYHRGLRQGTPEVIYGQNKTAEQILEILTAMNAQDIGGILVTRVSAQIADFLSSRLAFEYFPLPEMGVAWPGRPEAPVGSVVVASGGTSDMKVCEEAAVTAETLGSRVTRLYDVGVAGIHRLLFYMDVLTDARVVVAVAGMEGALASVIGGLVGCPVIAVPTSVGYGASFGGLSALLSMLNACAAGVSVVNIDNGFGAGYLANMINRMPGAGMEEIR